MELRNKGVITNTKDISKNLKNLNLRISNFKLDMNIGLFNVVVLSYVVAILDIIISIILTKSSKTIYDNYRYIIKPIQTQKPYFKLFLNATFCVKMSNIVKNILYSNKKKSIINTY